MIFTKGDDSFQNSPINLVFYEKKLLPKDTIPLENSLELASMSFCKLSNVRFPLVSDKDIDNSAYNMELLLSMKNMTAQFVSREEYQQLLFILGFKDFSSDGMAQDYQPILTLFKEFNTATKDNFKEMIQKLQFPFVYDEEVDLAQNRHDFKDFFSCLTKIRCAVVEGSHCCESSCCLLQGYQLGDPIPLIWKDIKISSKCTLFKHVLTHVYYPKEEAILLDKKIKSEFKRISKKISDQKKMIVRDTWAQWMTKMLDEIVAHVELQEVLYKYQKNFFRRMFTTGKLVKVM